MHIQNEKIYMLIVEFGLNTPNPLRFPLYAPERVCKIVPQAGDEIDAIIWLQGRIIDYDPQLLRQAFPASGSGAPPPERRRKEPRRVHARNRRLH